MDTLSPFQLSFLSSFQATAALPTVPAFVQEELARLKTLPVLKLRRECKKKGLNAKGGKDTVRSPTPTLRIFAPITLSAPRIQCSVPHDTQLCSLANAPTRSAGCAHLTCAPPHSLRSRLRNKP